MISNRHEDGFTLVEAMIALVVVGLIMVGAFQLVATNNTAYSLGQSRAEAYQNARAALDTMTREIRVSGYDRSCKRALERMSVSPGRAVA